MERGLSQVTLLFLFWECNLFLRLASLIRTHLNRLTTNLLTDQLVYRCRQGDVRAYRELYDAYSKAMYNICLRMLGNSADAEDVLQEAFVQVFNNIGKIQQEASLSGWIKRIVVNHCLSQLRKKKVYFEEVEEEHVSGEAEVDEVQFALSVTLVKEAIAQLPDGYRTVLNLYLFEDYSHREIGELLGITESTAKTQYMRAKEKVRGIVKQKTVA
ncbi:sigma-70 family RNA polymerase sigma factor [Chitinophaga horti]|uniref:Sigma-70 family RNA polymerase sigma factor n=1 Tax=Chitinophaga horti TaxID=2920382 RepID=A0ABY6J7K9_9BACT|nr:sigma-70 family RNA polymerase sigma factor [Chitinophaga horti]UYQ94271.1 sigma-70 family RNA polymerase sigma factor [Chitinophaga horti]